ncbi:hypothetical protein MNJPNG_16560 [Cupriavidus oxalaticus]|uniref:hypothetical protein n=1 Tax=Cupriavidus oxalaticus TaxID=96344 RepID=UPI003F7418F3
MPGVTKGCAPPGVISVKPAACANAISSIPVLGFLSITVTGFIALFPGNIAGVECAAIFAIFTSQAWNMALSLYQSFRTIPGDRRCFPAC